MRDDQDDGDQQLYMGFEARSRSDDPETSQDAAKAIERVLHGIYADIERVMKPQGLAHFINDAVIGGMTTHEISRATGLEFGSISPRMKPLAQWGKVRDSGLKRVSFGSLAKPGKRRATAQIVWEWVTP